MLDSLVVEEPCERRSDNNGQDSFVQTVPEFRVSLLEFDRRPVQVLNSRFNRAIQLDVFRKYGEGLVDASPCAGR
jgi:hypothetical protein